MNQDNRESARRRSLLSVKAIAPGGYKLVDCTVRNISDSGAFLLSDAPESVPREGLLRFPDGRPDRHYRVVHGRKGGLGVEFTEPAAETKAETEDKQKPARLADIAKQKLRAKFGVEPADPDDQAR